MDIKIEKLTEKQLTEKGVFDWSVWKKEISNFLKIFKRDLKIPNKCLSAIKHINALQISNPTSENSTASLPLLETNHLRSIRS